MEVKLISITQPVPALKRQGIKSPEDLIVYCARVSNPSNQLNSQTAPKLIQYLIKHKHWSPFEMVDMCVEIKTSRAIAAQILRHRSFSFQEFCLSGDANIIFEMPSGSTYKLKIKDVYDKWHNGAQPIPSRWDNNKTQRLPMKNKISNMNVRVFDSSSNTIQLSKIKDVFYNGKNHVYELKLKCGRSIKCTKKHKFLTKDGFKTLEDAVKLSLNDDFSVNSFDNTLLATNGIPLHHSKEWMATQKTKSIKDGTGIQGIADEAGVSYHTIRKWLKKLNLQFTKKETALTFDVWNKGVIGYKVKPRTDEQKISMSEKTKKGKYHHAWRGGGRSERQYIQDYINYNRAKIYSKHGECCKLCKKNSCKIFLHHAEEVCRNPYKAYDLNNIIPLCHLCHTKEHKRLSRIPYKKIYDLENFDWDKVRPKYISEKIKNGTEPKRFTSSNPKTKNKKRLKKHTIGFSEVESIKYIGVEDTYDLEIENENHNYVANHIVVHNSQRYAEATALEPIQWRMQGATNRQVGDEPADLAEDALQAIQDLNETALEVYGLLTEQGVAKECARMILPLTTQTTLYMKGSIRSWIHYVLVRATQETQKEHRDIALAIKKILKQQFPDVCKALGW